MRTTFFRESRMTPMPLPFVTKSQIDRVHSAVAAGKHQLALRDRRLSPLPLFPQLAWG